MLRNPLDAIRSMRRHVLNMVNPSVDDPFLQDEEDVIARNLDLTFKPTNLSGVSLELLARHLRAATDVRAKNDRSVMIIHYSDMKRNLNQVVGQVAATIEAHAAPEFLNRVVDAASISSMRSNADQFAPLANATHFSSKKNFFATGEERGHAQLAPHLKARYEERLSKLLSPAEARWLDEGGPHLAEGN